MRINAHAQDVIQGLPPGLIENLIRNMDDMLSGRSKRRIVQCVDWRSNNPHIPTTYVPITHQIGFNAKEIRANAKEPGQQWYEIGDWKDYLLDQKAQAVDRFDLGYAETIKLDRMAEMILSTYDEEDHRDIINSLCHQHALRVFYHELRLKLDSSVGMIIAKGAPSPTSRWERDVLTITHLPEVLIAQLVGTTPPLSKIVEADWAAGAHIERIRRNHGKDGGVVITVA